jgi:hypothetical protein
MDDPPAGERTGWCRVRACPIASERAFPGEKATISSKKSFLIRQDSAGSAPEVQFLFDDLRQRLPVASAKNH